METLAPRILLYLSNGSFRSRVVIEKGTFQSLSLSFEF